MPFVYDPTNPISLGQQKQVYNSMAGPEDQVAISDADFGTSQTSPDQIAGGTHGAASTQVVGASPGDLDAGRQLADQAAYRAYLNARLALDRDIETHRSEAEKQRIALEAARDAWTRTYQTSQLSGYMPEDGGAGAAGTATPIAGTYDTRNGRKTVDQMRQELITAGSPDAANADEATIASVYGSTTGGAVTQATNAPAATAGGGGAASRAQATFMALPPEQRTAERAAQIWMAQNPGLSPQEAARIAQMGHDYYQTTGQVMPDRVANQALSQITGGRVTGQTPTLDREREQNRTTIDTLTLLSQLRGPENAITYARTLANLPDSIRQNIAAAMGRLPFTAQNAAQRGVLGDLGVGTGAGMQLEQQALPAAQQQNALPPAYGPRTAQANPLAYLPAPAAALPQPPPVPAGQAAGNAPVTGYPTVSTQQPQAQQPVGYWADASRGNPQPGMTYAQVITPQTGGLEQMPTYGPRTQPVPGASGELFNPAQISPTDYNRTDPYAKKVMWNAFEEGAPGGQGGSIESGQWRYARSLPRAYGPRTGAYRAA